MSEIRFDGETVLLSREETDTLAGLLRGFHGGRPQTLAHLQGALDRVAALRLDRFEQRELYEALYAATATGDDLPGALAHLRRALFSRLSPEGEPAIVDATAETFERDVVERSRRLPVIVYFWGPWCGPACEVLGPALEREVAAREGSVVLARVDVDAEAELAARFGVHTIPAVRVFLTGEVVRELDGPFPRREMTRLFDALGTPPVDNSVAQASSRQADPPC